MFKTIESEVCILGAVLMNQDLMRQIKSQLTPEDFTSQKNQIVYQAMVSLSDQGEEIIPTSILDALSDKDAETVDSEYIAKILAAVVTSTGTDYHVRAVKRNRLTRELMSLSGMIADKAPNTNPQLVLDVAKKRIGDIRIDDDIQPIRTLSDLLPDVYASLEEGDNERIPTGFTDLNRLIIGWQPGDLIIVAGRPGMGKSILAKEFAEAAGVPVLFFSLEMPTSQLIKRQLAAHSGINYTSIRRANLTDEGLDRVKKAADRLMRLPIAYSDKANMSIGEIAAMCETYQREHGLGMVVIDYLQLVRADGKIEHREREVAQISQRLKTMARDLDVPVICLAQLNRACETRPGNKQPLLSDLRESGSIEQDADTVVFIWREAVYVKKVNEQGESNEHEALLIVAKGRNSETGAVRVYFDGAHQRIRDLHVEQGGKACQA